MVVRLTQLERVALERQFNLADGHARNTLPQFWESLQSISAEGQLSVNQLAAEQHFIEVFSDTLGQPSLKLLDKSLLLPSASMSLELVANVMRLNHVKLLAPDPCFDNVINIFQRHNRIHDSYHAETDVAQHLMDNLEKTRSSAVLIVLPFNPSGQSFSRAEFVRIVEICHRKKISVIMDQSFRAMSKDLCSWDSYEILNDAGVTFVAIEDTGKFIASSELKASIVTCADSLFEEYRAIYQDFMIGHSPLVLEVLSRTLELMGIAGIESVRSLVERNRLALRQLDLPHFQYPFGTATSAEWVCTDTPKVAQDTVRLCDNNGVGVLTGKQFFWAAGSDEVARLRIALLRDPAYFDGAINRMFHAIKQ